MSDSEPEKLPNGADVAAATNEFKQKVEESQAKMQAEAVPPRRGPGRPRKNSAPAAPAEARAQETTAAPPAPKPPPDISKFLTKPIRNISRIPAARLDIPELMFSEEEAAECAQALNELLNAFLPDVGLMDPRTAAVLGAFSTFGSIAASKRQIYLVRMAEKKNVTPPQPETMAPPQPPPAPAHQTHVVDDAMFSRRTANA